MVEKNYTSFFLDLTITNFFVNAISIIASFIREQYVYIIDQELVDYPLDKKLRFKYYIIIGVFMLFVLLCTIIYMETGNQYKKSDVLYTILLILLSLMLSMAVFHFVTTIGIDMIKRKYNLNNNTTK